MSLVRTLSPLATGLALCLTTPAFAQSLPEAMAAAEAHSPSVDAAEADVARADAMVAAAKAEGGPKVVAEGQIGYGIIDPRGYFGLSADDVMPFGAKASVEYPLFTSGKLDAARAQADAGRTGAVEMQRGATIQVRYRTVDSYISILTLRRQIGLYRATEDQLQIALDHANLKFKVGAAPKTEVAQAEARLAEARAGRIALQGDLNAAEARFEILTGLKPLTLDPSPPLPPVPASLDMALDMALESSPEIAALRAQVMVKEGGVRSARADRGPMVAAYAEAASVRDQFFPGYKADSASAGLRARWTIFDGGRNSAAVSGAEAELASAEAKLREGQDRVRDSVISAWAGYRSAMAGRDAAMARVAATGEALRSVRLEVQVGAKPQLAQLDAEREHLAAQNALADAEAMLLKSAWALYLLTGGE